jgi:hypothetical protein
MPMRLNAEVRLEALVADPKAVVADADHHGVRPTHGI